MYEPDWFKQMMLNATHEVISECRFCVHINVDSDDRTPVQCVKYSGCSTPIRINVATCLSCQEYKRSANMPERLHMASGG
ncbi:MAG: hypothetical protein K0Q59_3845 [Paenibacillus sp.]|jgi:hypothetical protein|nr:hypothetical protein [Paenibacillus sp.]